MKFNINELKELMVFSTSELKIKKKFRYSRTFEKSEKRFNVKLYRNNTFHEDYYYCNTMKESS